MPRLLIYETIVHHLDTARYLFGGVEALTATMSRLNASIVGEDKVTILLRHDDGLPGTIDGHRFLDTVPPGPVLGEAWFEGERGVLHLSPTGDLLLNGSVVWNNTIREGYRGDSVRATQQHFIDCLQDGAPFESEAREYLNTVALVEAAYLSFAKQHWVSPVTSIEPAKFTATEILAARTVPAPEK
jgi:predicted dehydrogenase